MLDCRPTSITSIHCHSTISTTWPLLGCTTSLETMPQRKWWGSSSSLQSVMLASVNSRRLSSGCLEINLDTQEPGMTCYPVGFLFSPSWLLLQSWHKLLLSVISQVVHEIRNYPYPQLHLLALQSLNPSRHASAVRESYEVCAICPLRSRRTSQL